MKRFTILAMFVAMVLSVSAQYKMQVWMNGSPLNLPISLVDSVTFLDETLDSPDTPAEPETPTNIENGHEYVDLGLPSGLKWATCNVGATKPEESGDYFAWGETEPKDYYDWSTYKWCNGSRDTQTKYCTNSSYGTVDNKTKLELGDDAARANWGGSWRMPRDAEWTELREQCTWTMTTQNGVTVYKVTSKSNGRSIFLPRAGIRYGKLFGSVGYGYYWSSSLYADYPYCAGGVNIVGSVVNWYSGNRCYGFTVRPVFQ